MKTLASLFSGGGGSDLGAIISGLQPIAALEYDPAIAAVYTQNIGDHCQIGRIEQEDFTSWSTPFWLHASPPCTTASQANVNGGETVLDLAMAEGVCRAFCTLMPRRFSLENVWGYRTYQSFSNILATLHECGYAVGFWHLNSADFGVPQTRKRLILVSSLDHTPRKPQPAHQNPARRNPHQTDMFALPDWISWYAAIEDILHTLPDSQFAPWQEKRLPEELQTLLIAGDNTGRQWGKLYRETNELVLGVGRNLPRAFIVDGQANEDGKTLTLRNQNEPIFTVTATPGKRPARIFTGYRVVKATIRCLCRWQSVPDSYILSGRNKLDGRIIGNMVPPLLMQRVIEANL